MYYEQPMEDGTVTISRAKGTASYPSSFLLVAAVNPCPCGYLGDKKRQCKCMSGQVAKYKKRISGPILDRIDIHVDASAVEANKLIGKTDKGTQRSKEIQKRVQTARNIQIQRFVGSKINSNTQMSTKDVKKYCLLSPECRTIILSAASSMNLTARSYF